MESGRSIQNSRRELPKATKVSESNLEESELFDPRKGGQPLRVRDIQPNSLTHEPSRTNYFGVYRIDTGSGSVAIDDAHHRFAPNSLICVVPYQYVRFVCDSSISGNLIEFHANFLCVETFHAEVGCAGRLFNDPYGTPVLPMNDSAKLEMLDLFARIKREQTDRNMAFVEASLAYLKLILIQATRLKETGDSTCQPTAISHLHPTLMNLNALIEERYQSWHSPTEYAQALCVTPKSLARLVKEHLGTTPTNLIRRRILTHAKWQLLHTLKPVKEVAAELGYQDELYFSRMFKKAIGVAPTYFREFETVIRGGKNLSIPLV